MILKHLSRRILFKSIRKFSIFNVFRKSDGSICVLPLLPAEICKRILFAAHSSDKRKALSTMISLYSSKVSKYPQELVSFLSEILPNHRSKMNTIEEFGATHINPFVPNAPFL